LAVRIADGRQALIRGFEVRIGAAEPYGHLASEGHEIVPRGPSRSGRKLTRERRAEFRANLRARRSAGGAGFVPGTGFAERVWDAGRETVIARLEAGIVAGVPGRAAA